jgi:aldehyde:ferredoxin oxidoreductase
MGSKRLKAVVVKGEGVVPVIDLARAKNLRNHYLASISRSELDDWIKYGTAGSLESATESGDSPIKNWGGVPSDFSQSVKIGGDEVIAQREKKYGCWRCPMACSGLMRKGSGLFKYESGVHQPEYETLSSFGPLCLNDNLPSIIKLNDICNRFGLDTISTGATVAFAIECYENGLITKSDTDGIELKWGASEAIVTMAEKLARRESFGEILADGVKKASEKIEGSKEYAIHIGGQEVPMHNPKYAPGFATTYGADATPSRHTIDGSGSWEAWGGGHGLDLPDRDKYVYSGKGEIHKRITNLHHALSCLGLCGFSSLDLKSTQEFISAIIGWDIGVDELLTIGERIANARQLFNIREGLNPLERVLPKRILSESSNQRGPLRGVRVEYSTQLREYLQAMDWDINTGIPSKRKLSELGLEYMTTST